MFTKLKQWWSRNDTRLKVIEDKITAVQQENLQLEQALHVLEEQKQALATELEVVRTEQSQHEVLKNSDTPWVDVKTAEFNTERGVQIDLDWNPAFIQYLREHNIKGKTEEIVIQKWLAFLYDDVISKLEDQTIEESMATKTDPGEFE